MTERVTVLRLPSSTGGDPEACRRLTRQLVLAAVGLSLQQGWPNVLDSLLSAYVTLVIEQHGAAHAAQVLHELSDELRREARGELH